MKLLGLHGRRIGVMLAMTTLMRFAWCSGRSCFAEIRFHKQVCVLLGMTTRGKFPCCSGWPCFGKIRSLREINLRVVRDNHAWSFACCSGRPCVEIIRSGDEFACCLGWPREAQACGSGRPCFGVIRYCIKTSLHVFRYDRPWNMCMLFGTTMHSSGSVF